MRANFDSLKIAVEGMSGGKNTVIFDDVDMPSIMVRIPKMKNSQLLTSGGTEDYHDAFICDNVTYDAIYIGKYLASVVNGRGYSLAGKDPANNMNFDAARGYCRAKGDGWHMPTNALYAAIALLTRKQGTMPHGNTNYGRDHAATYETGFQSCAADGSGRIQRTATGSGPDSWYHDYNAATGIADLCGNVWEWASGLRLKDGEIQVIPYGNAMADIYTGAQDIMKDGSSLWKAINEAGEFVAPGSANTLKWDYTGTPAANSGSINLIKTALAHKQTDDTPYGSKKFGALTAASGLTVPARAKLLGLFPEGTSDADYDNRGNFWFRNNGERLPIRGGRWSNGANAGVFALDLSDPRTGTNGNLGFRVAYYGNL